MKKKIKTKRKHIIKIVLPIAFASTLLLSGCTSAKYKESMETGNTALQAGKYDEAITAFSTAIQEEPKDEEAAKKLEEATKKLEEEKRKQKEKKEREEIRAFLNAMKDIEKQGDAVGDKWDKLRESANKDKVSYKGFSTTLIKEILPKSIELADAVSKISAPNEETKAVHELLINSLEKRTLGLTEAAAALDKRDVSKVTNANKLFTEARKFNREYKAKMESLIKKYNP